MQALAVVAYRMVASYVWLWPQCYASAIIGYDGDSHRYRFPSDSSWLSGDGDLLGAKRGEIGSFFWSFVKMVPLTFEPPCFLRCTPTSTEVMSAKFHGAAFV